MPGVNEVSATIEQVLFRGQITHVHMKMSDGTLLLSNQSSLSNSALLPSLSSGAEVIASWRAESGRIVLDS
jgi:putative spermidine/putrescine transport system ATP-binding protein